ncbi:3-methyladenine DNA glycosylase/8-oxoguanine DNA glycosylase [Geodermatophilus bullaregiensis]|nr:3-methyladenine DNA glycosylase/8-oxoguanine DNA glycosylase [Geodermatophilus bullaregiensis]
MPAGEARAAVRELPGIGPFSADLVVVRGAGAPDVLPTAEPRLTASLAELYGLTDPSPAGLAALAERWRPYRSRVWVFLSRGGGRRSHSCRGRPRCG